MDETTADNAEMARKIRRLVEERGWNQEEFARISRLNRHTVRQILLPGETRRLRNATVSACARALGLTVSELRDQPLDRLLPRMVKGAAGPDDALRRTYDQATQPELLRLAGAQPRPRPPVQRRRAGRTARPAGRRRAAHLRRRRGHRPAH